MTDGKRQCCGITLNANFNFIENIFEITLMTLSKSICEDECRPQFCNKYIQRKGDDCGSTDCTGFCPLYIIGLPFTVLCDVAMCPCKSFLYCEKCCFTNKEEKVKTIPKIISTQPKASS